MGHLGKTSLLSVRPFGGFAYSSLGINGLGVFEWKVESEREAGRKTRPADDIRSSLD